MSAYKYYDRLEEIVDEQRMIKEKIKALDELFREPNEGDVRVRRDGRLEVYTNGKWLYP